MSDNVYNCGPLPCTLRYATSISNNRDETCNLCPIDPIASPLVMCGPLASLKVSNYPVNWLCPEMSSCVAYKQLKTLFFITDLPSLR